MAPFKMKGSPMKRNFGVGSPLHDEKKKTKGRKKTVEKGANAYDLDTTLAEKFEEGTKKATEALNERSRIRKAMKDVIEHGKGKTSKKTKKSD
jgi:hypothetical protein